MSSHNLSSGIADNSWVAMEIPTAMLVDPRMYPKKNGWILRRQTVQCYWELEGSLIPVFRNIIFLNIRTVRGPFNCSK